MIPEVRSALRQENVGDRAQDGMDVYLCRVEASRNRVIFAGAKRPLFMVKNGKAASEHGELIQIKGDRKSIGGRQKEERRIFTSREISIQNGDMIYLTSDGFVDQANPDGKKYGSKRIRTVLESIARLDVEEQNETLLRELTGHQGGAEQRDDITMVGVKV